MRRLPRAVVVAPILAAALVLAPSAGAQTPAPAPPPPVSCAAQPQSHQFDFWVGEWDVTTLQGGHAGDSSVQKILGDCVVFENWHGARGGDGKSLNAYNAPLGRWEQFWVSSSGTVTEYRESRWVGTSLELTAHVGASDAPTMLRMTFTPVDANTVRQFGERSKDGGQTWAAAYDLYYHRKG